MRLPKTLQVTISLIIVVILMSLSFVSGAQEDGSHYEPLKAPKRTTPLNMTQPLDLPSPSTGVRAVPGNNNFGNAAQIPSLSYATTYPMVNVEQSNFQAGEGQGTCASEDSLHSIWYTYTPAQNVTVNIDLSGSTFDTILTVYRGTTLGGLTEVTCNDDYVGLTSAVISLNLTASTKYYFRISEYNGDENATFPNLPSGSRSELRVYQTPPALNVNINTTSDTVDSSPGNGACADNTGKCSLRAAIIEANFVKAGSIINIPSGTFTRNQNLNDTEDNASFSGDLDIVANMIIQGAGAGATIINANNTDSVFHIQNGANVQITGVTLKGGNRNYGIGGAIRLQAAEDQTPSRLTIDNVDITGNTARLGGGISIGGANFIATNSTIRNNTSTESHGGGIDATFPLTNNLTFTNVTIAENTALSNGTASGGGIAIGTNTVLTTNNVSILSNTSKNQGGGIYILSGGTAKLANTLVVKNTSNNTNQEDCAGVITSSGNNMFQTAAGCNGLAGSDLVSGSGVGVENIAFNAPAKQLPTAALKTSSPAFNAGSGCVTTDQRGVSRPQNNACDIGAYELVTDLPVAVTLQSPANNQTFDSSAGINLVWSSAFLAFSYQVDIVRVGGMTTGTVLSTEYQANSIDCNLNRCVVPLNKPSLPDGIYTFAVSAINNNGSVPGKNSPTTFVIGNPVNDVVTNGSFETSNGAVPVGWNLKNRTKDKTKCNKLKNDGTFKVFSYGGDCAFMFKGGENESSKLKQRLYKWDVSEGSIDISPYNLESGSTVTLTLFYMAPGDLAKYANGKALAKVKYKNNIKEKTVLKFKPADDYTLLSGSFTLSQASSNIDRIVVIAKNRSVGKKILVDNMSLYVPLKTTALRDTPDNDSTRVDDVDTRLVPLPEVPSTMRD